MNEATQNLPQHVERKVDGRLHESKVDLASHTETFISDKEEKTSVTQKPDGHNEDEGTVLEIKVINEPLMKVTSDIIDQLIFINAVKERN